MLRLASNARYYFPLLFILLLLPGCQSQSSNTLEIGVVVPLTGDNANYGQSAKRGIEAAVQEINDSGGVNGRKINVAYKDSKAAPRQGVSAAQQLINVNQVPAIIGGITSGVTLAIAPIAEKNQVVLISPTASSPDLTDAGKYIFRNFPSDNLEGKKMAGFMRSHGIDEVAVLQLRNDYGEGVANVFKKKFRAAGGDVPVHERYAKNTSNFRSILQKARSASPDAYYVVGYYSDAARLIKQAREVGIESQFFATTTVEDPRFIKIGGDAVNGVIYPLASGYNPDSESDVVQRFKKTYKELYGEAPGFVAAQAYDCVYLIKRAVERGNGFSGPAIQKGMAGIEGFKGATGEITFNKHGNVDKELTMKVVRNGKFKILRDTTLAFQQTQKVSQ